MKPFTIQENSSGFLYFTINRPEKRNAINYEVMDGLESAISLAANDNNIKALIITGAGNEAFCSGGDLSVFQNLKTEIEAYSMLSKMSQILYKLLTLPKPTVALLNGSAVGGGCELAAACDYRLAKKGIKAGFVQGRLAITTGWGGGSILFEKLLPQQALKMLMDASLFDTEQLRELGFIDISFEGDPVERAALFLDKLKDLETAVLSAYKMILIRKWKSSGLEQRIEEEVRKCSVLWESEAHHNKVNAFLAEK